jgi:anaerobic selenocysteine-containing dehydrogenase
MTRLAGICAGQKAADVDIKALDDGFVSFLAATVGVDPASVLATSDAPGPERILDLSIRSGPWGDRYGERPGGLTLDTFKAAPDGLDFGPMVPRLREVLRTPSGRLELAPAYILGDLPRLAARLERVDGALLLTSRRHLRSKNSWMHNVPVLVGGSNVCTLMISPQDAERAGVLDGELATVTSEAGSVDVPVQVTADMMPGVVSLPHGWGHGLEGSRLAVAAAHAGVNNNLLAPGTFVDELSGNAAVNGIPVTVVPAVPVQREQRAEPAPV